MAIDHNSKYRNFRQIVNALYHEELNFEEDLETSICDEENKIQIEPKLIYNKLSKELKVEFRIGKTKLYKIKELTSFYTRMLHHETYKYGTKLEFAHKEEKFAKESRPLLLFLLKYAEIMKYVNDNGNSKYRFCGKILEDSSILLSNTGLDDLFKILQGKKVLFKEDETESKIELKELAPDIVFEMKQMGEEYSIRPSIKNYDYILLNGKEHEYMILNHTLYCFNREFKDTTLKVIDIFRRNFTKEIVFSNKELPEFFSLIVPKIKKSMVYTEVDQKEIEKYIPEELQVKLFLDANRLGYVLAEVKFCYGEIEFNPLDIKQTVEVARDMIKETKALNLFRKTGFQFDEKNAKFVLVEEEAIYNFLSQDIQKYMGRFEVLVTDEFKKKEIKKPKLGSIGVRVENELLTIDLSKLSFNKEEVKDILEKYRLKKKYHRLKDGSFLELEENHEVEFLNHLEIGLNLDGVQMEEDTIQVPVYRSLYLNNLLEKIEGVEIEKNEAYLKIVQEVENKYKDETMMVPKQLENRLRYYQKVGFQWLKTLEGYKLGGILADDMGLGKTVQIVSVLVSYVLSKGEKRLPSIVIAPSSLSLNWKNEVEKFAPELKVLVITGKAEERLKKIETIPEYDLIVTSYDLLKRDSEVYGKKKYEFQYAIADEAQYIKNSNTQNAKALKTIHANTRFALTGTPIENSLAELWSIFDYIMPGYLFSYRKFKTAFELPIVRDNDDEAFNRLKMLIEPFILRRIKKDVLQELPEKSITILNSEMEDEQAKVYMSYLAQAKSEMMTELNSNGFGRSQIKILALLTRLRQICCHPKLFLSNYEGDSSKLNQCMEVLKDGIDAGHKILLFSGYTSMFEIIEKELKKEGINYYKLTGATKVDQRVDLVEDFNENKDIKVFLISLKAGGTGLNLIGADMVVHYDPWWNISAENQATDRAYRIGQKNNVQVYKLITKNSIEEKMYELQQKKAKLIDDMLDTKTTFINKLSKEDIMGLFE